MARSADADVLVVGMGPAGSTCARLLSRMGLSVIGIDKSEFPRRKPCGGCVTDRAVRLLGAVIDSAVEREYRGARLIYRDGNELVFRSDRAIARGVSREVFDDLLLREAIDAGVDVRLGEGLTRYHRVSGFIEAETGSGFITVRYMVGADGVNGKVSRSLNGERPMSTMAACEARFPGWPFPDPPDTLRIYVGTVPGGYAWAFPKAGYTSAGIVTASVKRAHPRSLLEDFLEGSLRLEQRGNVEVESGLLPFHRGKHAMRLTDDRVLLVGDSGCFVDPFLAEGISYAVQSAFIAAPVIVSAASRDDGDLGLYESASRELILESFDSSSVLWKYVFGFPRLAFLVMKRKAHIAEELFDLIRGNKNYQEFLDRFKRVIGSRVLGGGQGETDRT